MKIMKLEFVLSNISQENAVFLWNIGVKILQFFGFDVTGDVTEITKYDFPIEEIEE